MQGFVYPLIAGIALIIASSLLTYRLQLFAWALENAADATRYRRVVYALFASFAAHLVSITLYAGAYVLGSADFSEGQLGELLPVTEGDIGTPIWLLSLYFSAASYTSLGYGDVVPLGGFRVLAALEALNGLVLIGWSATFTFLSMREFQPPAGKEDPPSGGLE